VGEDMPEGAMHARFGDDEICAILPGASVEDAYRLAEEVLGRLAEGPEGWRAAAGLAEYPEHGSGADEIVVAASRALIMAKRVGGNGIVAAR
jgi:GGDEF domain-containing protein